MGGAVAAVENGYMKAQLVESNARRVEAIERGEQVVVGVNRFTETEPSPLAAGEGSILTVPPEVGVTRTVSCTEVPAGSTPPLKVTTPAEKAGLKPLIPVALV